MKLLKRALLLMITAAVYGLRSYANARRNATAADSPALRAQTSASPHRLEWAGQAHVPAACGGVMAERGIAAEPAPEIIVETIGIPGPYEQIALKCLQCISMAVALCLPIPRDRPLSTSRPAHPASQGAADGSSV